MEDNPAEARILPEALRDAGAGRFKVGLPSGSGMRLSAWDGPPSTPSAGQYRHTPWEIGKTTMSNSGNSHTVEILLVEDNPGDVRLIMKAFKECRLRNHISVAEDGVEAIAFLHRQGKYASALRPHLILLDLNLPRKSGREVLEEIKVDPELRRIPVVVLTTSSAEHDLLRSYDLHANCYINKPVDLEQFVVVVRSIEDFWLSIVRLPSDDKF